MRDGRREGRTEGGRKEREKPSESENEEEMGSALSPAASVSPDPFSPFQLSSLEPPAGLAGRVCGWAPFPYPPLPSLPSR